MSLADGTRKRERCCDEFEDVDGVPTLDKYCTDEYRRNWGRDWDDVDVFSMRCDGVVGGDWDGDCDGASFSNNQTNKAS